MCYNCDKKGSFYTNDTLTNLCSTCWEDEIKSEINYKNGHFWRVLAVESLDDVNFDYPGTHWTNNTDLFYDSHFLDLIGFDMDLIQTAVILEIVADYDDIDFDFTAYTRTNWEYEEEITIYDGSGTIVAAYDIFGNELWRHDKIKPMGFTPETPDYDLTLPNNVTCECGDSEPLHECLQISTKYVTDYYCFHCIKDNQDKSEIKSITGELYTFDGIDNSLLIAIIDCPTFDKYYFTNGWVQSRLI